MAVGRELTDGPVLPASLELVTGALRGKRGLAGPWCGQIIRVLWVSVLRLGHGRSAAPSGTLLSSPFLPHSHPAQCCPGMSPRRCAKATWGRCWVQPASILWVPLSGFHGEKDVLPITRFLLSAVWCFQGLLERKHIFNEDGVLGVTSGPLSQVLGRQVSAGQQSETAGCLPPTPSAHRQLLGPEVLVGLVTSLEVPQSLIHKF